MTALYSGDDIVGLSAEGHSGYAERGSDIVCAAVSALMQALWLGLGKVVRAEGLVASSDSDEPSISLSWDARSNEIRALSETVLMSIEMIAKEHPKYVKLTKKRS